MRWMMKKNVFLLILCLFVVLTACGKQQTSSNPHEKEEKASFYKKENQERYQAYQKQMPDLSFKDVILRVNIGLDQPYYTHTVESPYQNTNQLLVNKYYYLGEDYVPKNLVELDGTYSKGGIYLVKEAAQAFQKMVDQAKADGYSIRAISAYRSYQYQVHLYQRYVDQDGQEEADTYSARPGFSEHQTGLCVDVDNRVMDFNHFEETKSFQWMMENAARYGFILRYPKGKEAITGYQYEAWHYRYVGEEIANDIKEHGMTYDEYYMEFIDKE